MKLVPNLYADENGRSHPRESARTHAGSVYVTHDLDL